MPVSICGLPDGYTDGMFHWIYDDIYELVKLHENDTFKGSKPIEHILTQTLLFDQIPDFSLLSHGDYAGIED
ncbi:hypothetical protein GCM10007049_35910 [Echinicola pacifica]|uniref:Uncharacterized protein n=1 Tax=Echinicola pacifica TaxID=346377 RepID=A0A918QC21_9BACT|nr:hypothetical protein GCM10007049_35910 [Echinicola pacifica]